jgi:hypothetical protein
VQSAQAVPDFVVLLSPPYLARERHSTGRGAQPTNFPQNCNTETAPKNASKHSVIKQN